MSLDEDANFQRHLPVFVQPSEINFILVDHPEAQKQPRTVTIFNPYEFPIRFKILCNAPTKYTVGMTRGFIRAGCFLDIIVRHKNPVSIDSDCLRIEIYRTNDEMPCGWKNIPLNVITNTKIAKFGSQRLVEFNDEGETYPTSSAISASASIINARSIPNLAHRRSDTLLHRQQRQGFAHLQPPHNHTSPSFYWLAIFSFAFCLIVLLLPRHSLDSDLSKDANQQRSHDDFTWIPNWLRPSHTAKYFSSYILGILTVYFFLQPAV